MGNGKSLSDHNRIGERLSHCYERRTGNEFTEKKLLCLKIMLLGICMPSMAAPLAMGDDLSEQLQKAVAPFCENELQPEVERVRLDSFETACAKLLTDYPEPAQQGRIYSFLARIYVQTSAGQFTPAKAGQYAEKALQYPLPLPERVQMYIDCGQSVEMANSGATGQRLAVVRREAVMPYLLGLKEMLPQDLPETAPEFPTGRMGFYNGDGPQASEEARKHDAEQSDLAAAWESAKLQGDLIVRRDAITDQIEFLYSRMPFATEELNKLANEILQNPAAVERLLSRVKKRIQRRLDEMGANAFEELPPDLDQMGSNTRPSTVSSAAKRTIAHSSAVAVRGPVTNGKPGLPLVLITGGVLIAVLAAIFILRKRNNRRN